MSQWYFSLKISKTKSIIFLYQPSSLCTTTNWIVETRPLPGFDQSPKLILTNLHLHHSAEFCQGYLLITSQIHLLMSKATTFTLIQTTSLLPGQLYCNSLLTDSPLQTLASFQSVTAVIFSKYQSYYAPLMLEVFNSSPLYRTPSLVVAS